MAVLSVLRSLGQNAVRNTGSVAYLVQPGNKINALAIRRMSEHRTMKISPSRWSWVRFKDLVNFYVLLGIIPTTIFMFGVNIFIGPARLVETPEDYVPEHWEYYSHPVTRWMAKNICRSYQQEYEMALHKLYEEEYKQKLRGAQKRIEEKMAQNLDFQGYLYIPATSRNQQFALEEAEKTRIREGSD